MQSVSNNLLSVPNFAALHGVSIQYIHRLCKGKKLAFTVVNGVRFIDSDSKFKQS